MQQCLESCLLANSAQGQNVCVAVACSELLSKAYAVRGANCFLKARFNGSGPVDDTEWTSLNVST